MIVIEDELCADDPMPPTFADLLLSVINHLNDYDTLYAKEYLRVKKQSFLPSHALQDRLQNLHDALREDTGLDQLLMENI